MSDRSVSAVTSDTPLTALNRHTLSVDNSTLAPTLLSKQFIDIEDLLQWAVAQAVVPKLRVPSWRELTLNPYDVRVRGTPCRISGQGIEVEGGRSAEHIDASRVLAAVDRLDPWSRSLVLVNARRQGRPDYMAGVEPRRIAIRKRSRSGHRRIVKGHRWEPVSPAALAAVRELYGRWHAALDLLAKRLDQALLVWVPSPPHATEAPWLAESTRALPPPSAFLA